MLSSHFGLSFLWQRPRVPWAGSLTCWLQYELTRETVPVSNFQLLCCGVGPVVSDDVSPRIIVTGVTACQITDIWCMTVWHKLCGPAPIISSPGSSISSSQHISANLDVIILHYFTSNLFQNFSPERDIKMFKSTMERLMTCLECEEGVGGARAVMLRLVSPSLCSKAQSNCVQSNLTNRIRKLYSICPPHSKC